MNTLNSKCVQSSLLEIWRYRPELVNTASQEEILRAVNQLARSPWYGYDADYSAQLGGVTRDVSGDIVAARAALMVWSLTVPEDAEIDASQGGGVEVEQADLATLAWEQQLIAAALELTSEDTTILPNAGD